MTAAETPPAVQGLDLFEVYEASGSLLVVTSALSDIDLAPTDVVFRRAWATSASATQVRPLR